MQGAAAILAGLIWSSAVLWAGKQIPVPIALIQPVLMGAFFAPGLVLAAMVLRAQGLAGAKSGRSLHEKAVRDTIPQVVLAVCLWPFAGFTLGAGTVLVLSVSLACARLVYWLGLHTGPALRDIGFAASLYPTLLAALFAAASLSG